MAIACTTYFSPTTNKAGQRRRKKQRNKEGGDVIPTIVNVVASHPYKDWLAMKVHVKKQATANKSTTFRITISFFFFFIYSLPLLGIFASVSFQTIILNTLSRGPNTSK